MKEICIVVGDIHGRKSWLSVYEKYIDANYFVIVGDYMDSFNISYPAQIANLTRLTQCAESDSRVKLLLGNHDYHYIVRHAEYSGYQKIYENVIQQHLFRYKDYFKPCFSIGNLLISHAGVTDTWANTFNIKRPNEINELWIEDKTPFGFLIDPENHNYSPYGDDVYQGPMWVREPSLHKDPWKNYIQVYGHTWRSIDITETKMSNGVSAFNVDRLKDDPTKDIPYLYIELENKEVSLIQSRKLCRTK